MTWSKTTRQVVLVEGPDAVGFVDSLVSQDVAGTEEGAVRRSFLLSPQGKLRALLWITRRGERVALLADWGRGDAVAEDLGRFRIRVKAEVSSGPEVIEVWDEPVDAGEIIELPGSTVVIGDSPLSGPQAAPDEIDRWRLRHGEPRFGVDVDESTIPQETGLVGEAVSFTKGCYLGQELVARIDSRGHVNRHLRLVRLPEGRVPRAGVEVVSAGRPVGTLSTVGVVDGVGVGMGLIRREVTVGDTVEVDGEPALVLDRTALVPGGVGG